MKAYQSELPEGFELLEQSNQWQYGFLFRWSGLYESWLDEGVMLSVKPDQDPRQVICDHLKAHGMVQDGSFDVFAPKGE